jgi:uncharacterized Zn-binding protein involved in type VI secretion
MANVAVAGDKNTHVGVITPNPAAAGVTINGLPVIVTASICACVTPHHASTVVPVGTVTINGLIVAKTGSPCACGATVLAIHNTTVTITP